MLYRLSVLIPVALDSIFWYLSDEKVSAGAFVLVQFGKNVTIGVVWECSEYQDEEENKNKNEDANNTKRKKIKLKHIVSTISILPKLDNKMLQFIDWVSKYTMSMRGMVLKMAIPLAKSQIQKLINDTNIHNMNVGINDANNDINAKKTQEEKTIKESDKLKYCHEITIVLNDEQKSVSNSILKTSDNYNVSVIDGVTGSGKTEVYLYIIHEILKRCYLVNDIQDTENRTRKGGQVLILLPEIVLTTQLLERFIKNLPHLNIVQWHSGLTPVKRRKIWYDVQNGAVDLIVGARSALFLPFNNLKFIVVDEEHDPSFKQDDHVIYNARDMAIVKANIENIPIVLSSATVSIETIFNINNGKFHHYKLYKRYSGVVKPDIQLLDISKLNIKSKENNANVKSKENSTKKNFVCLHNDVKTKIKEIYEKKKQSLIFINRRGYASIVFCTKCQNKAKCPNCSFWLVYHSHRNIMQCHYCGYSKSYQNKCIVCDANECIITYGIGAERIAEEVTKFLPNAKLLILTSDTINTQKKAKEAINLIFNGEVDVIIGTQMIAKGLHFPNLQLVIVAEAEPSTLGADIRALERTYQVLYQVIGRAGREKEPGIVLIQTHEPKSDLLNYIKCGDTDGFIKMEMDYRKAANMPPFTKLVCINFSSYNEIEIMEAMQYVGSKIPNTNDKIIILGPAPSPITVLNKKYRYRIIIRTEKNIKINYIINNICTSSKKYKNIDVRIDIDPYNFY